MRIQKTVLSILLSAFPFAASLHAQSSPPGTADVTLQGKTVTIRYSRPSMRGRKIMGELVPYGQIWRTGANEATALQTPIRLNIGGAVVPPGDYTLYSLPSENAWKLVINKQTGQSGTEYDEKQDLVRVDLHKSATDGPVERFTISWKKASANMADLILEWERTRLSVRVSAP